ncbi:lipocalin [Ponticoccus sp. (in: a-proteobacteria)]|uniref:lipocalin n=1 Tax=Ponticoccus sp. (in: a-proteobacteria) TaxID=1925025 RepID=UPI003AB30794
MIAMRWWAFCVLTGCTALEAPNTSISVPVRNPTASVASQSDVTVGRLSGSWWIVQGAGVAPGGMVRVEAERIVLDGVALPLRPLGEGRFRMGDEVVWVHWLDFDNRTAALGNPDGSRVWIMDRIGDPGERLDAARDVLAWYGYDVSRLDGTPQ